MRASKPSIKFKIATKTKREKSKKETYKCNYDLIFHQLTSNVKAVFRIRCTKTDGFDRNVVSLSKLKRAMCLLFKLSGCQTDKIFFFSFQMSAMDLFTDDLSHKQLVWLNEAQSMMVHCSNGQTKVRKYSRILMKSAQICICING